MFGLVEFLQRTLENVLFLLQIFLLFNYKNKQSEKTWMVEMDLSITKSFQGAVGSSV